MPHHYHDPPRRRTPQDVVRTGQAFGAGAARGAIWPFRMLAKAGTYGQTGEFTGFPLLERLDERLAPVQEQDPIAGFVGDILAPGPGELGAAFKMAGASPFIRRVLRNELPHIEKEWLDKNFTKTGRPKNFPLFTHGSPKHIGDTEDLVPWHLQPEGIEYEVSPLQHRLQQALEDIQEFDKNPQAIIDYMNSQEPGYIPDPESEYAKRFLKGWRGSIVERRDELLQQIESLKNKEIPLHRLKDQNEQLHFGNRGLGRAFSQRLNEQAVEDYYNPSIMDDLERGILPKRTSSSGRTGEPKLRQFYPKELMDTDFVFMGGGDDDSILQALDYTGYGSSPTPNVFLVNPKHVPRWAVKYGWGPALEPQQIFAPHVPNKGILGRFAGEYHTDKPGLGGLFTGAHTREQRAITDDLNEFLEDARGATERDIPELLSLLRKYDTWVPHPRFRQQRGKPYPIY